MRKLIVFALVLFMISCVPVDPQYSDGKYDYCTGRMYKVAAPLQNIDDFLYMVRTKVELADDNGVATEHSQTGVAFSIDGKHLIALKHVVTFDSTLKAQTPFGLMEYKYKTNWEKHYVIGDTGEEIELECRMSKGPLDVAVLWADGVAFAKLPSKVGNSDELRVGQAIILSRTPVGLGHTISVGVVGNLDVWERDKIESFGCFVSSIKTFPGDSGNPVFAIRDGELELVGISQATLDGIPDMGYALKISSVMVEVDYLLWIEIDEEMYSGQ